jgi:NAD+ synthase (glutamine-hydrolysing)
MRLGLAQLNTIVGDLAGNRRKIVAAYTALVAQGAELVVFPGARGVRLPAARLAASSAALCLTSPNRSPQIAAAVGSRARVIGTVEPNPTGRGRPFYNSAAFCYRGAVVAVGRKCLLPTYDVFDEDRYFEPANSAHRRRPRRPPHRPHHLRRYLDAPDDQHAPALLRPRCRSSSSPTQKCDLMVNLSASPWHHAKENVRHLVGDRSRPLPRLSRRLRQRHRRQRRTHLRRSFSHVVDAQGHVTAGLAAFSEELRVVDIPLTRASASSSSSASPRQNRKSTRPHLRASEMADIYDALVLGLRDYAHKSGFKRALIALSGGIDSALVAVIAAEAFGPENVIGVSLPSAISSNHSKDDARRLAQNLGIRFETIAIAEAVAACETALGPDFRRPQARRYRGKHPGPHPRRPDDGALQQIRLLLLTTGNKSEVAVGYCTLYGDMAGGLAVISDVFKTQVFALSRWINRDREIIPHNTITKPPSAELRPGQTDQDSLPPYDQLDAILKGYVEEGLSRRDLVAQGFRKPWSTTSPAKSTSTNTSASKPPPA